jgi:thiosulfate/3-mercaptopyruvate sulfurtransferase
VPYTTLISTADLADRLSSPDWRVVDCRFDLTDEARGEALYAQAHIPGAVYASLSHDLSATPTGGNGRHPLPDAGTMAATFGRLGISSATQVVAYDQGIGSWAARLWWMLRYLGHDAVAVLDGGFAKWVGEGRETRSGTETAPRAIFTPRVRGAMRRTIADVEARLHEPFVRLVDARAPERFEGRSEPLDRVAGHIPGAINAPYTANAAEDGTMKDPAALRARFEALLGGASPDHVVMYCGSGVTACHNLLAMEVAGLPGASLYAGSWSEWSADPSRPVETGPGRPGATP